MTFSLLAAAALQLYPWLSFMREPSFHQPIAVEIGTLRLKTTGPNEYWFKETVTIGDEKIIWWTDTVRCPAGLSVLRNVRELQMPRVDVPFLDNDEIIVTADGIHYELSGDAAYDGRSAGGFMISSNVGTPLAKWVDESIETLSPCWSKEEPANSPP